MIKKFKYAFSLSELLIVLAIISVISVMLISISKSGVEKAFNMYYYTGYSTLSDIIGDAVEQSVPLGGYQFADHMAQLLDVDYNVVTNGYSVKAKNGIKYVIKPGISYVTNNTTHYTYPIEMTIPSQDADVVANFAFFPDEMNGILTPGLATKTIGTSVTRINLHERRDLLPFYLEDGINGVILPHVNTTTGTIDIDSSTYNKKEFYSFKEAICKLKTEYRSDAVENLVFGGCKNPQRSKTGYIRVANPQKI